MSRRNTAKPTCWRSWPAKTLAKDPALKAEFEQRIQTDPQFAASPGARLEFFYERSPWFLANRVGEYPVGRLLSLDGLPLE